MFFFNLRGLRDRLITRPLSERECFQYLVGVFFLRGVMESLGAFSPRPTPSGLTLLIVVPLAVIFFAIGYFVLQWLYECNGGQTGENFLSNLLAVSFVVYCWYTAVLFPLSAISAVGIAVVQYILKESLGPGSSALLLLLSVVTMVVLFGGGIYGIYMIGRTLREIRSRRLQASAPSVAPQ